MKRTVIAASLAGIMLLAGCSTNVSNKKSSLEFNGYPIQTSETLSYWMPLSANLIGDYNNLGETPFGQELEKATGIKIEYVHPVSGQEEQSLSLAIASDELADIVEFSWATYMKGAENSIKNETIFSLNDLIETDAPNLAKYLSDNPDIDRMVKTDSGQYYVFPFIRSDESLLRSTGMVIRKDWLDELGLKTPTSVSELEDVMRTMKKEKNLDSVLTLKKANLEFLLNLFGATGGMYVDNGTVKYGPLQDSYKTAVSTLNKWINEGLLDSNYINVDSKIFNASVLNDRAGIMIASGGGDMGTWLDNAEQTGKKFVLEGVADFKDENGKYYYHQFLTKYPKVSSCAITTSCKNPELAARFLDYAYSEEGHNLYNFGTEGVSYEMQDGTPVYTDLIKKNPDGLSMPEAMSRYIRASGAGPFVQDKRYIEGYYFRDAQRNALEKWTESYSDVGEMNLPPVSYTSDENKTYADIMVEVNKYVSQVTAEFIFGTTSVDQFDTFVNKIKSLNIESAVDINNAALKRYNAR